MCMKSTNLNKMKLLTSTVARTPPPPTAFCKMSATNLAGQWFAWARFNPNKLQEITTHNRGQNC